jgi:RNA polymerase sigma factor (sigma-70 family)
MKLSHKNQIMPFELKVFYFYQKLLNNLNIIVDNNWNSAQGSLWSCFKGGDRKAFDVLLKQYYPLLLNYGVRLVSDTQMVEDCLQDFFIDLWHKRAGLGDVQSLKAYLLISFRRRLFRDKEKNNRLGFVADLSDDYYFEVQFDIETDLIIKEITQENTEKLKYLLENLSKRQREAIYLRFYQD